MELFVLATRLARSPMLLIMQGLISLAIVAMAGCKPITPASRVNGTSSSHHLPQTTQSRRLEMHVECAQSAKDGYAALLADLVKAFKNAPGQDPHGLCSSQRTLSSGYYRSYIRNIDLRIAPGASVGVSGGSVSGFELGLELVPPVRQSVDSAGYTCHHILDDDVFIAYVAQIYAQGCHAAMEIGIGDLQVDSDCNVENSVAKTMAAFREKYLRLSADAEDLATRAGIYQGARCEAGQINYEVSQSTAKVVVEKSPIFRAALVPAPGSAALRFEVAFPLGEGAIGQPKVKSAEQTKMEVEAEIARYRDAQKARLEGSVRKPCLDFEELAYVQLVKKLVTDAYVRIYASSEVCLKKP